MDCLAQRNKTKSKIKFVLAIFLIVLFSLSIFSENSFAGMSPLQPDGSQAARDTNVEFYNGVDNTLGTGYEFRLDSNQAGNQVNPAVAPLKNGNYIAVWEAPDIGGASDIYGQLLSSRGAKLGDKFLINTNVTNSQCFPRVAGLDQGGFVVVWDHYNGTDRDIYFQRFNDNAEKQGVQTLVNSITAGDQFKPDIMALANGGFVIVWTGYSGAVDLNDIYLRSYSSTGNPWAEIKVNTTISGNQMHPRIASYNSTYFVVTWEGNGTGDSDGVFFQRYNVNSVQQGTETRVNSTTSYVQYNPVVTGLKNGGFVVAWSTEEPVAYNGRQSRALFQIYDTSGSAVGGNTDINPGASETNHFADPELKGLHSGDFLCTFHNYPQTLDSGTNSSYLYFKIFSSNGAIVANTKALNTYQGTNYYNRAAITTVPTNIVGLERFILLWNSNGQDTDGRGVYSKIYSIGPAFYNITKDIWYAELQDALDGASENNTIAVIPGEHKINSQIIWPNTSGITLRGYEEYSSQELVSIYGNYTNVNSTNVIIDAQNNSRIFSVSNGVSLSIKSISLVNGYVNGNNGAALYADSGAKDAKITFDNVIFEKNRTVGGGSGGALMFYGGATPIIRNCLFRSNSAEGGGSGGALYVYNYTNSLRGAEIENTTFITNYSSYDGGAIYLTNNSNDPDKALDVTINNCIFVSNNAAHDGGAIVGQTIRKIYITNSIFRENQGPYGGAIYVYGSPLETYRSYFVKNYASQTGGAVYVNYNTWLAHNCVFRGNTNGGGTYSGAAYNYSTGNNWDFYNCTFVGNKGIIYSDNSNYGLYFQNSIFYNNNTPLFSGTAANSRVIRYSYVQDGSITGEGNIYPSTYPDPILTFNVYPFLFSSNKLTNSPLFDRGENYAPIIKDIENFDSPQNVTADMGAYEGLRPLLYDFHPGNTYTAGNDFNIVFRTWMAVYDVAHPVQVTITDLRATPNDRSDALTFSSVGVPVIGTHFTGVVLQTEDPFRHIVDIWPNNDTLINNGDHFRVQISSEHKALEGYAYWMAGEAVEYRSDAAEMEFFVAGIPYLSEWFENGVTESNTTYYGASIGNGADINEDNYPDLIIGDPNYLNKQGKAYLYYGGPARDKEPDATFYSTAPEDNNQFGKKVLLANVNNDAFGDILIGEPGYNNNDGRLLVYLGSKAIYGASAIDVEHPSYVINVPSSKVGQGFRFGENFDIGELNRDGADDIIIPVPSGNNGNGAVYIYSGMGLSLSALPMILTGPGDGYATALSCLGDIDRDGADDIAVGVPNATVSGKAKAGKVQIYFGESTGELDFFDQNAYHQVGIELFAPVPSANDYFGYAVAKGGDVDHDNFQDILVGKYTFEGHQGCAWVFYGGSRSEIGNPVNVITLPQPKDLTIAMDYAGEPPLQQFGMTLASAGDLDGDDNDDILIGAPEAGADGHGLVYLYMGGEIIDWNFDSYNFNGYVLAGHDAQAHLGRQITNLGDFNADGYQEIAMNDMFLSERKVQVYYNNYATDLAGPMFTYVMPFNDMTGVLEDSVYKFTIFDRGKSGLNLNSLELKLYPRGMEHDSSVVQTIIHPGGIGSGKKTYFDGLLVATAQITVYTATASYTYTGTGIGNAIACDEFKQIGKVRGIDIQFKLAGALRSSEGYELKFSLRDWGPVPIEYQVVEFVGNLTSPNIIAFSVNQDIFTQGMIGNKIKNIGDYNNDGFDDLAIFTQGANSNGKISELESNHPSWFQNNWLPWPSTQVNGNTGYVLIYFGGPDLRFATPNIILVGDESAIVANNNRFAADVFGAGQMNKQYSAGAPFFSDIIILDSNSGKAYRYPGQPLQRTELPIIIYDYTPLYIANGIDRGTPLRDINNDDYPDFAVSDGGVSDKIHIVYGASIGWDDNNITELSGNQPGSGFGKALANAGDVDGDDIGDLIVGAPNYDNGVYTDAGAAYLIKGKAHLPNNPNLTIGLPITGIRTGAHFGYSVAGGYLNDKFVSAESFANTSNAFADLAIGAPNDNQFGENAGSVTIYYGHSNFSFLTAQKKVLIPESTNSEFGTKVVFAKFISTPEHYKDWSFGQQYFADNITYFDDYDDLIVSAKIYDNLLAPAGGENGKIYIYTGGGIPDKPDAAYAGGNSEQLADIINAGDIVGIGSDFIGAASQISQKTYLLRNFDIPDTTPPIFTYFAPLNNAYDVPVNPASIMFEVADASGISTPSLQVYRYRRDYTGEDKWIIYNGAVTDKALDDPVKEYNLFSANIGTEGTTVRFTLAPNANYAPLPDEYPAGQWTESEPINLEIYVGDGRLVWVSETRREHQPLVANIDYGFMTQFKPNEAQEYEIFGQMRSNSYFGASIASVGDVDGDGFADFIVGEYGNNEHGPDAGKVYLFLGSGDPTELARSDLGFSLGSGSGSSRFGYRVAPAGDMNFDGYDDVAVVGLNSGSSGGEVFVLYGGPGVVTDLNSPRWDLDYLNSYATLIRAENPEDGFGRSIWGGGDINGDGYDDLVIGAPYKNINGKTEAGRTYVILGRKIDTSYRNLNPNSAYGAHGPITIADLDSYDDVNLSNYSPTDFNEDLYGFYLDGENTYDRFGFAVLTGLNINGDQAVVNANNPANPSATKNTNISEFIIGAPGADQSRGKAYIYTYNNASNQLGILNTLEGEESGDQFGFSLASLGDITNDFNRLNAVYDDFVIGAPYNNNIGINAGAVYIYLGGTSFNTVTSSYLILYGQNAGDLFGYALANVGNVDNDERNNNDLAVSAIHNSKGGYYAGRVYIFGTALDLNTNTLVIDKFADFANEGEAGYLFGFALAGIGDVDGDFVPEYLIGAPAFATNNVENMGRIYLVTNPDNFGPTINMAMLLPIPNSTGNVKINSYWDDALLVTINEPLTIRIYAKDNRVINIGDASIELRGEDENRAYTYYFDPPQTGVAYYTLHNRKTVEFFVVHPYYRYGEWVDVTVNITDTRGNLLGSNHALEPQKLGGPFHFKYQIEENPWGGP
ncbi:MAG: FG-GAP repeat protein, partial [Candidatus Margulisbacteria bacterium]|nr:FG-GAP repeat protein [Candidatus Margulisiibacteriota bacterium]